MEPSRPEPEGEEEEWQRWRAKRARLREERASEEKAIQAQLTDSNGVINRLLYIIIAIGVLNFACFSIAKFAIGGSAAIGKIEGEKFYVGSHGRYTEVPKRVFGYSRIHGHSIWISHPAAMGSMVLLGIRKAKEQSRRERLLRRLNQLLR